MKISLIRNLIFLIIASVMASCKSYKNDIMFKVDKNSDYKSLETIVYSTSQNYQVQINDEITLKVYSANGELLIDANKELIKQMGGNVARSQKEEESYFVDINGSVNLPLVGLQKIELLTIRDVDSVLSVAFGEYYPNCYVKSNIDNRRVTVLGPMGGKVVPLTYDNMNLIEVISLYGGIDTKSNVTNIRLIRGDLKNPSVSVIDLSTIKGLKEANTKVENGDIIYIEPIKKVINEAVRDISPVLSIFTSMLTIVLIIIR